MSTRPSATRDQRLREALERLVAEFDPAARLERDPLGLVRRYPASEREVVAHVAAPLSYGAVPLLRRAIEQVLEVLGTSPTSAVRRLEPGEFSARRPDFVYRMTRAADIDAYLSALGALLREHGTLAAAFRAGDSGIGDVRAPLIAYVDALHARMPDFAGRGARFLTPNPAAGSATKRWHLMLRWLVRSDDGADLGLWTSVGPARLVLPLDTHTSRLVRHLGLTERRSVDYRMAREATDGLARLSSDDPLRYDMALCHLGISGRCAHRHVAEICGECSLRGICLWTRSSTGCAP